MIKYLLVFAALFVSASCQDATRVNPQNCGLRPLAVLNSNKVVGGKDAKLGDWGWQVSMNYSGRFICGGSLINSQWILTAAHCISSLTGSLYSFDIGHHDRRQLESWAVTRTGAKVIKHPSYSATTYNNDIALVKLSSPVTYKDQIVPICIPDGKVNYAGRNAWATGWGSLVSGGAVSRYLQEVAMPFLTDTRCKQKYTTAVTATMVCAGENGQNKDTCQGDSGGPLTVQHLSSDPSSNVFDDVNNNGQPSSRWYSVGITSWGYGCGDGGVYARTSAYYSWIKQQLKAN